MRYLIYLFFISLSAGSLYGQTALDLARYSQLELTGSARGLAVGGSMGAIGGDIGTLAINPAGIATYRWSEIQLSGGINSTEVTGTIRGGGDATSLTEDKAPFIIPAIAYVNVRRNIYSNWPRQVWSIGVNRVADFNETIRYRGVDDGSIADRWLEGALAEGQPTDAFGDVLAFNTGAIYNFDDDPTIFFNDFGEFNVVDRNEVIRRTGGVTEVNVSYGASLRDKLYLGASANFSFLQYSEIKSYSERDVDDVNPAFENLNYNQNLEVDGQGFSIKLGAIWSPSRMLKLGGYIHTPNFYLLDESFETDLLYSFVDPDDGTLVTNTDLSPTNQIEYNVYTPWRFGVDAGLIVGKLGFISADVSYINYRGGQFDFTTLDNTIENQIFQDELNAEVDDLLNAGFDIKAGAELAVNKHVRLRGGAQFLTPLAEAGADFTIDDVVLETRKIYSAGIGLRQKRFFLDVAYQFEDNQNSYTPYTVNSLSTTPVVDFDRRNTRLVVSLGVKLNPQDVSREYEQF